MATVPTPFRNLILLQDSKEVGVGAGDMSDFRLAPSSSSPTGRALGPAGSLYPTATSLSHGSMFLNHSRDVTGNLGHGCSIRGPDNLGSMRVL